MMNPTEYYEHEEAFSHKKLQQDADFDALYDEWKEQSLENEK